MSQRLAVVIDDMGTLHETPDEELDGILKDLRDDGLEPELVHYGHDPVAIPDTQIDLLVVDYGVIATKTSDWTRHLLRWAEDHPGSLLLIWSSMTADGFVEELREVIERGGQSVYDDGREWTPPWPANVRAVHSGNKWYAKWGDGDGVDWLRASSEYVRAWFGLTEPTPIDLAIEAAGPLRSPDDQARVDDVRERHEEWSDAHAAYLVSDAATAYEKVATATQPPRMESLKIVEPGQDGGLVGAVVEIKLHHGPRRRCIICDADKTEPHHHCQKCGTVHETDVAAHDDDPAFDHRHRQYFAVNEAMDAVKRRWQDRLYPQVWAEADPLRPWPTAIASAGTEALAHEVGDDVVVELRERLRLLAAEDEARRQIAEGRLDTSRLTAMVRALVTWLEEDPDQGDGGWSHLGFRSSEPAVDRPVGALYVTCHPGAGRVFLRLSQDDATKHTRSASWGARIVADLTTQELDDLRTAIVAGGLEIDEEWQAQEGVSYYVTAPTAPGPNVLKGTGGMRVEPTLPEGW